MSIKAITHNKDHMQDRIRDFVDSPHFEVTWRIPFEKENGLSLQYAIDHIKGILGCDCWAAGTLSEAYFDLYNLEAKSEEYLVQRHIRDDILLHDPSILFDSTQKVYIILGGDPFRYLTIEYRNNGLGIITDFQRE